MTMKKMGSLFALLFGTSLSIWADRIVVSTTAPDGQTRPEHLFTMQSGNGFFANATTAPTQTETNQGLFAFYAVPNKAGAYYIYSHSAKKWLSYQRSASYSNGLSFVKMTPKQEGKVTIIATAVDGSGVQTSIELTVTPKQQEPYAVNFDKTALNTHSSHELTSVCLTVNNDAATAKKINLTGKKSYYDFTAQPEGQFSCKEGDQLKVTFTQNGGWMHAYTFIDLDNDQQFSYKEGSTNQAGTDVMTFSFYSGDFNHDTEGVNSANQTLTGGARNTLDCPVFQAPAKAGSYRIRFKYDWNSVDPGGQLAADGTATGVNGILANGGTIVDAILEVTGHSTGIDAVESPQNAAVFYDLSGNRLKNEPAQGVYIKNNQKYVK